MYICHQVIPRRKILFLVGLALTLIIIFVVLIPTEELVAKITYYLKPEKSIYCFSHKINTLDDITDREPPKKDRSIFFLETSCRSYFDGRITLSARQACAVESAARLNPNFDVFLLFASPGRIVEDGSKNAEFLNALRSYDNVNILHVDFEKYLTGTPIEKLLRKNLVRYSEYAQSHASDVLRYLTLWKYGGIYLDLDVIVVKSLENLPLNYAGAESEANVAAGVVSFTADDIGHEMASECLMDLRDNFSGTEWGRNGPGVITRMTRSHCGAKEAKDMVDKHCDGYKVYPTSAFYAIPWWNWTMFFDEKSANDVMQLTENSYVIHVWNKHSAKIKLSTKCKAAYVQYAKKSCPKVFSACKNTF